MLCRCCLELSDTLQFEGDGCETRPGPNIENVHSISLELPFCTKKQAKTAGVVSLSSLLSDFRAARLLDPTTTKVKCSHCNEVKPVRHQFSVNIPPQTKQVNLVVKRTIFSRGQGQVDALNHNPLAVDPFLDENLRSVLSTQVSSTATRVLSLSAFLVYSNAGCKHYVTIFFDKSSSPPVWKKQDDSVITEVSDVEVEFSFRRFSRSFEHASVCSPSFC